MQTSACITLYSIYPQSKMKVYTLDSKEMPRFALGSFKWICLYRRRLGGEGVPPKQPEPRGKIVNIESPSHSYSFYAFLFVG